MTLDESETVLAQELGRIAPEISVTEIERDSDLREEFDIDSVDFLNLVLALCQRLDIEIPEADYAQMQSYNSLISYLSTKTA